MKRNWFVIANAARARVLEESDKPGVYTHVADLVHPQSRQKGVELAAAAGGDRPGHVQGRPGGTAYQPRTDPRDREQDRFAYEVANSVNRGIAGGRCAGVVLVASDPFLGMLKSHLDAQARKLLLRTVSADYTAMRDDELAQHLGSAAES